MKTTKRQPQTANAPAPDPSAFGKWMMSNVRREIAAGRVRTTIDEHGERHAIN